MKKIRIKLTTAGGKVVKSTGNKHCVETQKDLEEFVESVPEMKHLKLATDNGPTYIYADALATCVIELVIYEGADKS